jgi:hypothetical protein
MEKKGELLNQLAIISDLIEKINIETKSQTLVFELSKMEFEKAFELIQKKYGKKSEKPTDTFTITIGMVDIVFNTSNV